MIQRGMVTPLVEFSMVECYAALRCGLVEGGSDPRSSTMWYNIAYNIAFVGFDPRSSNPATEGMAMRPKVEPQNIGISRRQTGIRTHSSPIFFAILQRNVGPFGLQWVPQGERPTYNMIFYQRKEVWGKAGLWRSRKDGEAAHRPVGWDQKGA